MHDGPVHHKSPFVWEEHHMPTTIEPQAHFDEIFRRLLEASNLVQRLRDIEADPIERIDAHNQLLQARIDAQKARAVLD